MVGGEIMITGLVRYKRIFKRKISWSISGLKSSNASGSKKIALDSGHTARSAAGAGPPSSSKKYPRVRA